MLPQLRHCAAVLLGLAPIALGALPPVEATAQGRPAAVLVETVEMRQIADTTPVIGRLVGSVEAQVAARAAGVVDEVLFQVGDEVAAGQTLVRLDADLYEIARSSAQAA
ncbi:MAG: biotin/lipoyl-binding protein, partial [Pseudomonadota bacterium]